jgi:hypothetical protein
MTIAMYDYVTLMERMLPNATNCVIYDWFWPDATLLIQNISSKTVYGTKKMAGFGELVYKYMWADLGKYSASAQHLIDSAVLTAPEVQTLVEQLGTNMTYDEIACQWILSNRQKWRDWTEVVCLPGQYLETSTLKCISCPVCTYAPTSDFN